MHLLLTGGAGFIGSHLADALLTDPDARVTAFDNLSLGRLENLAHLDGHPRFSFVRGDVLDAQALDALFAATPFDAVFHLAANSDIARSHADPSVDLDHTFLTTYRVLDALRRFGVKQVVFASTSAIYGNATGALHEAYGPLFPVSHYGAGKLASEAFVSSFAENYGIQSWIVRFPNVVGERTTHGVLFDFLRKIRENPDVLDVLGDGQQHKPYVYVKDLVEAILFVWRNSRARLNCFNVGVETRTRVADIARMVLEETGQTRQIRYTGGSRGWVGDVPEFSYRLDAIHALGWRPRYTSDEAVRTALRQILAQTPTLAPVP